MFNPWQRGQSYSKQHWIDFKRLTKVIYSIIIGWSLIGLAKSEQYSYFVIVVPFTEIVN